MKDTKIIELILIVSKELSDVDLDNELAIFADLMAYKGKYLNYVLNLNSFIFDNREFIFNRHEGYLLLNDLSVYVWCALRSEFGAAKLAQCFRDSKLSICSTSRLVNKLCSEENTPHNTLKYFEAILAMESRRTLKTLIRIERSSDVRAYFDN